MSEKITFQKNYTRDTALFLQDIWARDQSINLPKLLGKENQHLPGIIHYVNNGGVEIWENKEATQWLLDTVLEKNNQDPLFLPTKIQEHKELLNEIKVFWDKEILSTPEELKQFAKLVERGVVGFNIFFRTAQDDRSPQDLREIALIARNSDTFFAKNDTLIHKSLSSVFPELKGYENYVFASEIDNLPSKEILEQRKNHFILVDGSNTFLGTLDEYAREYTHLIFEANNIKDDVKEIKGQIAQKGKAIGKVRILKRRDQVGEVKEGDIIVSPMTTPDFLPAMKVAAAFVTDEGGITCHAGIVARELKKPCVIGTKIATQVLKDGMEVEVDADNGIVRIIK